MAETKKKQPARKTSIKKSSEKNADLDGELLQQLSRVETTLLRVKSSYSGPVPSADMAEGYEKLLPGSADRFLTMAEQKQSLLHQQEMESLKNDTRRIRGSTLVSLSLTGAAVFAIWAGHPIAAVFIISVAFSPTIIRALFREIFAPAQDLSSSAGKHPLSSDGGQRD